MAMTSSQSVPNSESIPDANSQPSTTPNSQPSTTPELQSAPTENISTSSQEPDVIIIDNDSKVEDKELKKGKSEAWLHFDKVRIEGAIKAVCKYCGAKLRGDSNAGTSHLNSHYKTKHHNKGQSNIRQKLLSSNFNKNHPKLASYKFSPEGAKKELAKMIIMHEYPLSIVEHVGFKRYSSYLQPLFKVPCRNTIKNEIFQIYELEKVKTLSLLESNRSRVAITTDMWTASNQKKGYMAVTAHFIDASWNLQSRIMRKISCLTVDNCTTNDAMVQNLLEKLDSSSLIDDGNLFHMRCAAHILNLIVKDGLEVIRVGVEKIRGSVAYWKATPKREEKFEETARQLHNMNTKKLGLDCATRWNSTYLMLETALLYKDVFNRLGSREIQYKPLCPLREEWEFAQDVCGRLKKFYKEYHEKLVAGNEGGGDSTSTHSTTISENVSEYDLFISTKKRKRVDSIKSELDHYLEEDVMQKTDGFDLLNWWKVNELKYPNLQLMARDFLAIPASTVASESTFSSSGRLVSPHRNRLNPKTIEALMCAQSWLWAAQMRGESSIGYATIYNDMELEDSCITREDEKRCMVVACDV
ncbi:hypothetical protein AgCh_010675 [Apium graveolens]